MNTEEVRTGTGTLFTIKQHVCRQGLLPSGCECYFVCDCGKVWVPKPWQDSDGSGWSWRLQ